MEPLDKDGRFSSPTSPVFHRAFSTSSLSSLDDSIPSDKVTMLDLLDPFSVSTQITKKLNHTVRRKGEEFKNMALRQRDRVIRGREEDIEKLKVSILKQVDKLDRKISSATFVSSAEKWTFCVGVTNIFLIGYLIGSRPHWFHNVYTAELAVLLPIRIYSYRRKEYQYFLADLCYFANALSLLYIWVFPHSERLFISCYALTTGTLSWAVVTWRNSLVLHSLDKTTSAFIHILPPVVFHVITHCLTPEYKRQRFPAAVKLAKWNFFGGLVWTSVAYIVWQSLYHYFITIRRKEKIKAGRMTSFEWLRRSYANTKLGKFVNGLPDPFPVFAFTAIQFGYQMSTMLLCPVWYANPILSTLFMTFIFMTASYNGATYYIDVFGRRFQKELSKLEAEVAAWQANAANSPVNANSGIDSPNYGNDNSFNTGPSNSPVLSPRGDTPKTEHSTVKEGSVTFRPLSTKPILDNLQ